MARKKTVTRPQILDAAYGIVSTDGFSSLTARNIATQMGCSTQPIYLEFENMGELKDKLFERIYQHLEEDVFPKKHSGDPIVDLALNYMEFAKEEPRLYTALFLEKGNESRMLEFSYNLFFKKLDEDEKYANLTNEVKENLLNGTWVIATGVASLASSGNIHPTQEQKIQLMKDAITALLNIEHKLDLNPN
ncbi:MAG: TetR/AcrR family transcriptional regulator [Streptococcaceae bacterium]|nr:TetR/AcrR family transcriptional regulator [Streptococcaceae bacterium]